MRVTNAPASRKRRKRMLKLAKGFRLRRSSHYRYASDAVDHGMQYAYRDRKAKTGANDDHGKAGADGENHARPGERGSVHGLGCRPAGHGISFKPLGATARAGGPLSFRPYGKRLRFCVGI